MYAIIRDRGMQYRVQAGQTLNIALMDAEPGSQIELNEVLLVGGDQPVVGTPLVDGAKVVAKVLGDVKGEKIVVFRYRNKKRYRRRTGHRQQYTRIAVSEILGRDGQRLAGAQTAAPSAPAAPAEASVSATSDEV